MKVVRGRVWKYSFFGLWTVNATLMAEEGDFAPPDGRMGVDRKDEKGEKCEVDPEHWRWVRVTFEFA